MKFHEIKLPKYSKDKIISILTNELEEARLNLDRYKCQKLAHKIGTNIFNGLSLMNGDK